MERFAGLCPGRTVQAAAKQTKYFVSIQDGAHRGLVPSVAKPTWVCLSLCAALRLWIVTVFCKCVRTVVSINLPFFQKNLEIYFGVGSFSGICPKRFSIRYRPVIDLVYSFCRSFTQNTTYPAFVLRRRMFFDHFYLFLRVLFWMRFRPMESVCQRFYSTVIPLFSIDIHIVDWHYILWKLSLLHFFLHTVIKILEISFSVLSFSLRIVPFLLVWRLNYRLVSIRFLFFSDCYISMVILQSEKKRDNVVPWFLLKMWYGYRTIMNWNDPGVCLITF